MNPANSDHAYGQSLQEAMQQALSHVDAVRDALERERLSLAEEREALAEQRREIERNGELAVQAFVEQRAAQLASAAKDDVLLALAVKHLSAGATDEQVAHWLEADRALMQRAHAKVQEMQRSAMDRTPRVRPHNATLQYVSQGRGGTVVYRDDRTTFEMWWEFAASPAVAIIGIPGRAAWERSTRVPLDERDITLTWIADRAMRDQVSSGGSFRIDENHITLYSAP